MHERSSGVSLLKLNMCQLSAQPVRYLLNLAIECKVVYARFNSTGLNCLKKWSFYNCESWPVFHLFVMVIPGRKVRTVPESDHSCCMMGGFWCPFSCQCVVMWQNLIMLGNWLRRKICMGLGSTSRSNWCRPSRLFLSDDLCNIHNSFAAWAEMIEIHVYSSLFSNPKFNAYASGPLPP